MSCWGRSGSGRGRARRVTDPPPRNSPRWAASHRPRAAETPRKRATSAPTPVRAAPAVCPAARARTSSRRQPRRLGRNPRSGRGGRRC
eukprot:scaffold55844_cov54-Phaeocystis_antarctica.AAC.3